MDPNLTRADLIPDLGVAIFILAGFGIALWALAHWALRRYCANRFNLWVRAAIGVIPGTISWWLILQALASRGEMIRLQTPWPLLLLAFVGAIAIEAVSAFYAHECARVPPWTARLLVACRMGVLSAMVFVLAQPVLVGDVQRTVRKRILVLLDESASMTDSADKQMTKEERADVAKALGVGELPPMTRADMVRQLMEVGGGEGPLAVAARKYAVDFFRFGNGLEYLPEEGRAHRPDSKERLFRSVTDITRALELALEEVPAEEIAGVLLFTDGRHNGESSVGSIARRFGAYGIQVDAVVIGGTVKPFDLVVSSVDCRESVFEGDKVRFTVGVSATNANGRKGRLELCDSSGKVLETKEIVIDTDDWSREFKFVHLPAAETGVVDRANRKVLHDFTFRLTEFPGELSTENNTREAHVAVSDDRTNVLLVDDRPRWEYRYLRNLFYGRDKSVQLQEWVVHPDTIALPGDRAPQLPPAKADRPFGESAAGGFPESLDEWRKFDIIILGDIGEDVLTPQVVECIRNCVEERGALLVLISGSEKMPYSIRSSVLRDLMPVEIDPTDRSFRDAPEESFRFSLASAGRGHPVMALAASAYESEELWNDLPDFHWRLPIAGVKSGSEVLAFAHEKARESKIGHISEAEALAAVLEADPEAALRDMRRMRENQHRNALVVTAMRGRGRVLMLMTDSMWRLRSKQGDQQHHRFWGQVMRWGAGERLRAGTEHVRLGTDQICYGAGEPVKVYVRVLDGNFRGVSGLDFTTTLTHERGAPTFSLPMKLREGSNGFYEGVMTTGLLRPGRYDIELISPAIRRALGPYYPDDVVRTSIIVATAKRPAEDVDLTATREFVQVLATETKGHVYSASEYLARYADELPDDGRDGRKEVHDRSETQLWCSPLIFCLLVILLTTEWIFRKRARLA